MFDTTVAWKVISSGYHYYRSRLEGAYEYEASSVGRATPVCISRSRFSVHFVGEESSLLEWSGGNASSNWIILSRTIEPADDEFFHSTSQNRFFWTSSTKFNATFKDMNNKVCDTYYVLCTTIARTMSSNSTTLSSLSNIIYLGGGRKCLIFCYLSFIRHRNFSEFRTILTKYVEGCLACTHTHTHSVTLSPWNIEDTRH